MGLLYILPVSEEDLDRVNIDKNGAITIKSYGLPMIFWFYLLAGALLIATMFWAIKGPLLKLLNSDDTINYILGISVSITFLMIILGTLSLYFYEKWLTKKDDNLLITHKLFFIPILRKEIKLSKNKESQFEIEHFLDAPNVAKVKKDPTMRAFENQGHFLLFAKDLENKKILIDRHSRRADLKKIISLLIKY